MLLAWINTASGQTFSGGSTGADGAFAPPFGTTITVRPGGVYNYTTVNIGNTITYIKGSDNAPLVILATGDVNITGAIVVNGENGASLTSSAPNIGGAGGPGGFAGGNGGLQSGPPPTAGHGPGGGLPSIGSTGAQGGSYGAPSSFVTLIPLFGGSGGGGGQGSSFSTSGFAGGGGAGAILIASSTRIHIMGQIMANGGNSFTGNCTMGGSAGTGGAIRLVAPEITGTGNVQAIRGTGGCATAPSNGRIRMEAFNLLGFIGTTTPVASVANAPGPVSPAGNPALVNVPTLAITSIGGLSRPPTTGASYFAPDLTLALGTVNPVPVVLTATNTPVGSPTAITVRLIPQSPGSPTNIAVPTADHTGTFANSSASVGVTFPVGQVSVIQAFAALTLTGQTASLFPLIDGEPVDRIMVAAMQGQPSTVSLVTKSGKEVRVDRLRFEDQLRVTQAWEALKETRIE